MHNINFKDLLLNFFIFLLFGFIPIFINNQYTFAINNLIDNNILGACPNSNNCVFESWKVSNADKSFKELIDILKNTPRINIINIKDDYLHALATSRIMTVSYTHLTLPTILLV